MTEYENFGEMAEATFEGLLDLIEDTVEGAVEFITGRDVDVDFNNNESIDYPPNPAELAEEQNSEYSVLDIYMTPGSTSRIFTDENGREMVEWIHPDGTSIVVPGDETVFTLTEEECEVFKDISDDLKKDAEEVQQTLDDLRDWKIENMGPKY